MRFLPLMLLSTIYINVINMADVIDTTSWKLTSAQSTDTVSSSLAHSTGTINGFFSNTTIFIDDNNTKNSTETPLTVVPFVSTTTENKSSNNTMTTKSINEWFDVNIFHFVVFAISAVLLIITIIVIIHKCRQDDDD
jgi:hypothetical protein